MDREKIIKGLEYHLKGLCLNCLHWQDDDCVELLIGDALALLEEQQKRIETLESLRRIEQEGR